MIRVLIAASSPVIRAGLTALLRDHPAIEAVGSVSFTEPLPAAAAPDVVLVALDRAGDEPPASLVSGIAPAVLLADALTPEWTGEMLRAGARAVLPREVTTVELTAAIEAVHAGLVVLHPQDLEGALPGVRPSGPGLEESLTAREMEVLRMMADGLGNKQIAGQLGISDHTAKFHVASVLAKLRAGSRTEAVATGIRRGLIPL